MKISVKNLNGEKVKDLTLNDSVWNIETNDDCLKKSIKLQQAATRQDLKFLVEEENHGNKKVQDVLVLDLVDHLYGEAEELYSDQLQEITHLKLIRKKELLL